MADLDLFTQVFSNLFAGILIGACGRWRGYSFWIWAVAGFWADFLVCVFLLAWLPDRSLDQAHALAAAQLDRRLAEHPRAFVPVGSAEPRQTIGDAETAPPPYV